jgi:hypothetical protein
MASPRTFLPGVVTGETALNTIGQRVDRLYDNATPWATVTSGSEPDDVTVSINSNESGTPQDTAFLERGWLAGMGVRLAWPVTNTGAVTLAVNGGSALNIVTPEGDAIAAGQFPQGLVVELVYYDGDLVVVSAIPDATGGAQARFWYVFTASGTWNKPAGLGDDTAWHARLWGAGGAGSTQTSTGHGGGGGACAFGTFRHGDLASSIVVTIGAGGAAANPGGNGGNSTFGSLLTGYGGAGGGAGATVYSGGGGLISAGTTSGPGEIGGGAGGENAGNAWGGAGGGATGSGAGGNAYWGGAGGGAAVGGTAGGSRFGGDGGADGVAGQAPGGGGGRNAQGARGEFWFFN